MKIAEQVTFGGGGIDRAAHLRGDPAALEAALADGDVLALWRGKPLMTEAGLCRLPHDSGVLSEGGAPIFLGLDEGRPVFAQDISSFEPPESTDQVGAFHDPSRQTHPKAPHGAFFGELRAVMTGLSRRDAELAATAKALCEWHRFHGFCARCGAPNAVDDGGWRAKCQACGGMHFPRTDPVVIMLITHGNSLLVGRSPGWPDGTYSLLAGFVEPGETLEAAVRREVFEETQVRVGQVDYLSSQPWPFPMSLMFGCRGEALSREITLDPVELEDARWMTREEVAQVFAGSHPQVNPPRDGAIAHFLTRAWLMDRLE